MKRNVLVFLFAILASSVFALSKDSANAVTMVAYEQSWIDYNGTIALKNNTSEDIHNVAFVIKYLNMNGEPMDYKEYFYDIHIAPGMTKKLDIPAYEHGRHYHYYKTKDNIDNPAFKIDYELKGYNVEKEQVTELIDEDNGSSDLFPADSIFWILFILFFIGIYVGLYVLVAVLAKKRHRSEVIWLLLSFIATPVLIIIVLLCIGNDRNVENDYY